MITQEQVNEQLDNAQTNGYFLDLSKFTVEYLVGDLQMYSSSCGGFRREVLTPLVRAWYDARRKTGEAK